MRPRRDPAPRARAAGHWLGGVLVLGLLGGAVVSAAVLLWENLDVGQLASAVVIDPRPVPVPERPAPPAVQGGAFPARLYKSARNQAFFPSVTHYSQALARWRRLAESVGGAVVEIASPEALEALRPSELLIIPEAPCLSGREVEAIRTHLRGGGSLVANWAFGARNQDCEWLGWERVEELTQAFAVDELAPQGALYLTVPGGTPLSPGLDPGTRIEFRPAPVLTLDLPGPRAYWSDWALNPIPHHGSGRARVGAAVRGGTDGGRVSWFGFQLSGGATQEDAARLDQLVQNGIRWAAGIPSASVAPWPEGKRAALLIVQDVEAEFGNARALVELLREKRVPGTFYAVSALVSGDASLAEALSSAGEVGSHSHDHKPLLGLDLEDQRARLREGRRGIQAWAGAAPGGLRPPEETFDANTLRAWRDVGGEYLLATNQARSGSPELYRVGEETVVLLPRLLKDDYNVFVQDGARRAERLTEAFLGGMGKLRSLGGLAVLATHTQIIGTGPRLEAVRAAADTAKVQGDWWIVRAGEVADWWERRRRIRLSFAGGRGIFVEAPADADVRGVWVDVVLPGGTEDLTPQIGGTPVPFSTTDFGLRIPVGDLRAGETRRISLRSIPFDVGQDGKPLGINGEEH